MFNETNLEEFEDFIPLIGLCTFIGIIFICCVCDKTKKSIRTYHSLLDNDIDETNNNYDNPNNNNLQNQNNDKPPPYQHS
jgi:hypothetical protein